jgi:hypothetical protein
MSKNKSKKVYMYDYPENRELGKYLIRGDHTVIANHLGLSAAYIYQIFIGKRKMREDVRRLAENLAAINRERATILESAV